MSYGVTLPYFVGVALVNPGVVCSAARRMKRVAAWVDLVAAAGIVSNLREYTSG